MKTKDEAEELKEALRYFELKSLPAPLQEGTVYEIALAKVTYTNLTQSYIAVYPANDDTDREFYYAKTFAKDKLKTVKSVDELYPIIMFDKNNPEYVSPYQTIKSLYDDKGDRQKAYMKYRVTSAKKWNSMEENEAKELINKLITKNIGQKLKEYEEKESYRIKNKEANYKFKRDEERIKARKEYNLKHRES